MIAASETSWRSAAPDLAVLLGSGLFLCLNLFSFSGTPFLLGGDEQVFWLNAQRLLHGELIYRDFFEFTPPGTDLVYAGAFGLFGSRVWVPNVVQLLLGVTLCWLCFRISRLLVKPTQAALAAALFMVLAYGYWMDATHHWFSLLAVISALAVLLLEPRTTARILIAGALLGVASFFTQTRGLFALLGITSFLLWDRSASKTLLLMLSFVAAWSILSGYFIAQVGLSKLLYFQTTYVLRHVASESGGTDDVLTWPIRHSSVYFTLAIVYLVSSWKCLSASRDGLDLDTRRVLLLAFAGAALFVEVAFSPNGLRLDCVAMPGIILFVWLFASVGGRVRRCATYMICIVLVCLGTHRIWYRHSVHSAVENLPAGTAVVVPLAAEKLDWIARHTAPGQFFFQAGYQSMYLPLALRMPAFTFINRMTSPELVELDMRQLQAKRVQYVLWAPLAVPRFPQFERFLDQYYQRVWIFSDQEEIWERRD
jgi:dolichyl-phosphate-mannose-protein mannosyltransferase